MSLTWQAHTEDKHLPGVSGLHTVTGLNSQVHRTNHAESQFEEQNLCGFMDGAEGKNPSLAALGYCQSAQGRERVASLGCSGLQETLAGSKDTKSHLQRQVSYIVYPHAGLYTSRTCFWLNISSSHAKNNIQRYKPEILSLKYHWQKKNPIASPLFPSPPLQHTDGG